MPPKGAPNKKPTDKVTKKVVEDKTFGLKNKKGAKQQKFIQQVEKQVSKPNLRRDAPNPNEEREKKREEERKAKEELSQLFKPVTQTVAKGVDPKSVVCVFFKQGLCQKGDRCKFSHDLTKERKTEKRSIYDDVREDENDTMANWDDTKLEDVVNQKHGEDNKQKNTTQIVCKFFIEAVENATYGWFWVCPNEKDSVNKCMYRHALPPGFTLKKDKKENQGEEVALESLIEKERAGLGAKVTKVTLESFLAWKARKIQEKKDKASEQDEKKKRDFKLGFVNGLTGRDLFTFNPDLIANDDDEANNDIDYKHREGDDEDDSTLDEETRKQKIVHEINFANLAAQAREVDNTGTIATSDRFDYIKNIVDKKKIVDEEADKLGMAVGGVEEVENEADIEEEEEEDEVNEEEPQKDEKTNKIEIDESLFNLDDLCDIRDELDDLEI